MLIPKIPINEYAQSSSRSVCRSKAQGKRCATGNSSSDLACSSASSLIPVMSSITSARSGFDPMTPEPAEKKVSSRRAVDTWSIHPHMNQRVLSKGESFAKPAWMEWTSVRYV